MFGSGTRTVLELGGRAANQNDFLGIANRFAAGGTLAIVPWLSFAAAAGDSFDVMGWGERTRMFDEAEGLDAMAGVGLDPIFTDTGLTLQAKAITTDGTAGDDVLGGTSGDDVLSGRDGNDLLSGGAGNDLLLGGNGKIRSSVGQALTASSVGLERILPTTR